MTRTVGRHTHAVNETQWDRLRRLVEERRNVLGLTLTSIQAQGGPSPRWVQNLHGMTGTPTPRMRASMLDLDRALQWKDGTSWSLVADDRSGWSDDLLRDEERALLDPAKVEAPAPNARKRTPEDSAFAAQVRAERGAAGFSQDELARRAGLSPHTILRIENEQRGMDTSQLALICKALGITITQFVMRAEDRLQSSMQAEGREKRKA